MVRLRAALLAALLWCGVVAVVSTLVWVVISRAGQGVVPVTEPPVPGGLSSKSLPAATGSRG